MMKKRGLSLVLSAVMGVGLFLNSSAVAKAEEIDYTIINPYETVNWQEYGQYKANFHSHSHESDGGNTPAEMAEEHYRQGYDVYALTDHNHTNTTLDRTDRPATDSDGNPLTYLTSDRLAEMNAGVGRDGRGMDMIPFSNEQSRNDHVNTFWTDWNNESGSLEDTIAMADSLGGISHINHPGRYTGGKTTANNGVDGALRSSDPNEVMKYVNFFNKYDSLVGMEIINKKDGDSFSDRILWDNILKQMDPNELPWGFSNDDNHSVSATGFSWNMMLMPENNMENLRYSMENGTFYAVARVSKRELGMDFVGEGEAPRITDIKVDQDANSITIAAEYADKIQWVIDGEVVAEGGSIDLNDYQDKVHNYVRAQLMGPGGIAFTQAFGIEGGLERTAEFAIANLEASGTSLNSEVKDGIQLTASGMDSEGNAIDMSQAKVTFKSDNNEVITISEDGVVTILKDPSSATKVKVWAEITAMGKTIETNAIEILVTLPGEVFSQIAEGNDDVEENIADGGMYMTSSDLEITSDGSTNQIIGTRFTGVGVPQGAEIVDAYIQFTTDEVKDSKNVDPFNVQIHAELAANSAPYTAEAYNVSSRNYTSNVVEWKDIPKWLIEGEAGPDQRTPALNSLVQEVVNQADWAAGNAISFSFRGEGVRCAEAFEGGGPAVLYVRYKMPEVEEPEEPEEPVEEISCCEMIENLICKVEGLDVKHGTKMSLIAKLRTALSYAEMDQAKAAKHIKNFMKQADKKKDLSMEERAELKACAQAILDCLK